MVQKIIKTGLLVALLGLCSPPAIEAHKKEEEEKEKKEFPFWTVVFSLTGSIVGGYGLYKGYGWLAAEVDRVQAEVKAKEQAKKDRARQQQGRKPKRKKSKGAHKDQGTDPLTAELDRRLSQLRQNLFLPLEDDENAHELNPDDSPPAQPPQPQNNSSSIVFLDSRDNTMEKDENINDINMNSRPSLPILPSISQSRTSITKNTGGGASLLLGSTEQEAEPLVAVVEEENDAIIPLGRRRKKVSMRRKHREQMVAERERLIKEAKGDVLLAFSQAVKNGNVHLVLFMCELDNIRPDKDHLKVALQARSLPMVKYLIEEQKLKPSVLQKPDLKNLGYYKEKTAPKQKNKLKVDREKLIKEAKGDKREAFSQALKSENINLVRFMCNKDKIKLNEDHLEIAVRAGNMPMVKYLIEEKKIMPTIDHLGIAVKLSHANEHRDKFNSMFNHLHTYSGPEELAKEYGKVASYLSNFVNLNLAPLT